MTSKLHAFPAFGTSATVDILVTENEVDKSKDAFETDLENQIEHVVANALDVHGFAVLKSKHENSEYFSNKLSNAIINGVSRGLENSRRMHPIFQSNIDLQNLKKRFIRLLQNLGKKKLST